MSFMEIRLIPQENWGEKHVGTLNGLVGIPKNLDQDSPKNLHENCIKGRTNAKGSMGGEMNKIKKFIGKTPKLNPKSYLDIP
jgi:hypothetical protein